MGKKNDKPIAQTFISKLFNAIRPDSDEQIGSRSGTNASQPHGKKQTNKQNETNGNTDKKLQELKKTARKICDYCEDNVKDIDVYREKFKNATRCPTPYEICDTEYEAERYEKIYDDVLKVKRIYFGEVGIKSEFESILGLADCVPPGLNKESEDGKSLPLHSAVYNTYLNMLMRYKSDMIKCSDEILKLRQPLKIGDREQKSKAIKKPFKDLLYDNDADVSAFEKALYGYKQRMEIAKSKGKRYSDAVRPAITEKIIDFCSDYIELLDCKECGAMAEIEIAAVGGEVGEVKDTAGRNLTPSTYAYWRKLQDFAEKIRVFLNKWNEELK